MKQVALDNHVLIWGLREHASSGQEDMIPRAKDLIAECTKKKTKMMIPAVVLAELLTAIDNKHHALVHNLIRSSFVVPPFDSASAVTFAKLWQDRQETGVLELLKEERSVSKQELKADCFIVATCIAHKAEAIYSHDETLKRFANEAIPVLEIPRVETQESFSFPPLSAEEG